MGFEMRTAHVYGSHIRSVYETLANLRTIKDSSKIKISPLPDTDRGNTKSYAVSLQAMPVDHPIGILNADFRRFALQITECKQLNDDGDALSVAAFASENAGNTGCVVEYSNIHPWAASTSRDKRHATRELGLVLVMSPIINHTLRSNSFAARFLENAVPVATGFTGDDGRPFTEQFDLFGFVDREIDYSTFLSRSDSTELKVKQCIALIRAMNRMLPAS